MNPFDSITATENVTLLIPILYLVAIDEVVVVESISVFIPILAPSVSDNVTITENYSSFITVLHLSTTDNVTVTELFSSEYLLLGPQRPINRPKGYAGSLTGYTIGGGRDSLAGLTTGGY